MSSASPYGAKVAVLTNGNPASLQQRLMDVAGKAGYPITPAMLSGLGRAPKILSDSPETLGIEVSLETIEETFAFSLELLAHSMHHIGWKIHNFNKGLEMESHPHLAEHFRPNIIKWTTVNLFSAPNQHDAQAVCKHAFAALQAAALYPCFLPSADGSEVAGTIISPLVIPAFHYVNHKGHNLLETSGQLSFLPNSGARKIRMEHRTAGVKPFSAYETAQNIEPIAAHQPPAEGVEQIEELVEMVA